MHAMIMYLFPATVISSMILLVSQRKNTLMMLLSLEVMILTLMLMIIMSNKSEPYMVLIILTMGASEASIGLACLVLMLRAYGNDLISSISSNKW